MSLDHGKGKEQAALERLRRLESASRERLARRMPLEQEATGLPPRQLRRLLEISWAMNQIHDREELMAYVGGRLKELFDAGESFVLLFDERGSSGGRPLVCSSVADSELGTRALSDTLLERLRQSREPLHIDDVAEHPDLRDQSSVRRNRIASVLAAPLVVGDEVIGALWFDHRVEAIPFSSQDLNLLSLFADQAATAFNNLLLIERLGQALEDTRAAQDKLVQAERLAALGQMSAGVAHDFNNTLFIALGQCDVLLAREDLDEDTCASLSRVRTCALDAAGTVRRMQRFAQGQSELVQPVEAVEPGALLEELRELTRRKWTQGAAERGLQIALRTEVEPGTPAVAGHAAELREILINLVFNAVDALEEDGTIVLASGREGGRVFVAVSDDGPGMDEATRQRVFEPFFTTKGARGMGFGLATCWSLARRMGGEIELATEVGRGTTFKVWLPVFEGSPEELPAVPESGPAPRRRARVLIIDDDAMVLETVGQLLAAIGHDYSAFTVPEQALRAFRERSFDAVITDLGMPGLTGTDVARAVHRERPEVPVILLTGWGNADIEPSAAESVTEVLSKPLTQATLERSLSSVLAN